jgi:hypothetical protein
MPLLKGNPSAVPGGLMARFAVLAGRPPAMSMAAAKCAIAKTTIFINSFVIVVNSPMSKIQIARPIPFGRPGANNRQSAGFPYDSD